MLQADKQILVYIHSFYTFWYTIYILWHSFKSTKHVSTTTSAAYIHGWSSKLNGSKLRRAEKIALRTDVQQSASADMALSWAKMQTFLPEILPLKVDDPVAKLMSDHFLS